VEGVTTVKSAAGVSEHRLDSNGLTVLLAPLQQATVANLSVFYRAGSRDESYGTTGAAHLLEHMMFKGTDRHQKEAGTGLDQMLEGLGAETNATTSWDRTIYTTTLLPQHLPVILALEADRMRHLRLREEDFQPERQVVIDELYLVEDDPVAALDREIWATAFQAHPYRHAVIGWEADVRSMTRGDLREFYDRHYRPERATVIVTGGIPDKDALLAEIRDHFGPIPRGPEKKLPEPTPEPAQTGMRRFEMKRPGETGILTLAYKSPPAAHPDFPALMVLCDLLADGQNSRFYQELTETGVALDVTAAPIASRDPSLLLITAELAGPEGHGEAEEILLGILDEVMRKGVPAAEVELSKSRLAARFLYDRDGPEAFASVLGESLAAGDWALYQRHEAALAKITPADLRRVARQWLVEEGRTSGWLLPTARAVAAKPDKAPAVAVGESLPLTFPPTPPAAADLPKVAPRVRRTRSAGMDLVICPAGNSGVIHLAGSLPLGRPADEALASFTAAMIERGTTRREATAIGDALDAAGATLEFEVSQATLHFHGRCLRERLPVLIDVLAEQLREPSFPADEIGYIREQLIGEAGAGRADADVQAALAFNRSLHPAGHPGRLPDAEETIERLKSIRREDLVAFHREWFGPAGALIVLAGDVDAGTARERVERAFDGWTGGKPAPALPPVPRGTAATLRVPLAGRESVRVLLGQPFDLAPGHPDATALALASAALGNGFTSRLVHHVRDSEGLTYGVDSSLLFHANGGGAWLVSASFSPALAERGVASIRREIGRWYQDGLADDEFAYHRSAMAGAWQVGMATGAGLADRLHDVLRRGLPLEWIDDFPARLSALTREQVHAAVRQHLSPESLREVKCGDLP
jgi:zinc protease